MLDIIEFISNKFAKGYYEEDEEQEFPDDVKVKYLVEDGDRDPYWCIELGYIYSIEDLVRLDGVARKNGFKLGIDTHFVYFDEVKKNG
jgi:hypothetical protein